MSTTLAQSQWIDLGIHTEACITQGNCASGALSFWLKVIKCQTVDGIISTYSYRRTRGFYLFCYSGYIGYVSYNTNINLFICNLSCTFTVTSKTFIQISSNIYCSIVRIFFKMFNDELRLKSIVKSHSYQQIISINSVYQYH